jgi:hypothetical protein
MREITYCLVYKPDLKPISLPNLTCRDKNIHIRLKNYNKPEVIAGAINKLTYLLVYLFQYCYIPTIFKTNEISNTDKIEEALVGFNKSKDINNIKEIFNSNSIICNNIIIKKPYTKSKSLILLPDSLCPIGIDNYGKNLCSLDYFLSSFKTTLKDYLLDDKLEIHISRLANSYNKVYLKFNNKSIKNKHKDNYINYINTNLW